MRTTERALRGWFTGPPRPTRIADWLVVAIAVSLPWSTSASAVLIVLWWIAVYPALGFTSIWHEIRTPAGGLPVAIWVFAVLGMLWADVSWSERLDGLRGFHKLLFIPLLLAQFRHSDRVKWAILAFLISSLALLTLSWLTPYPGFLGRPKADVGVPVKDYVSQSMIFTICAFGLLGHGAELWQRGRIQLAMTAGLVGAAFLANILFVATARATLLIIAVLFVLFGFRQFAWKGMLLAGLVAGVLASLAWVSSPYLRGRVTHVFVELQDYGGSSRSSAEPRLEYWKKSLEFIADAPVVGHGTGAIASQFRRTATATDNPHNQILAVAIDLGAVGTLLLLLMWIAHVALFRQSGVLAWYGLTVVVANIVGSLFNTHLFDFTQGWLYVFGVGILGGAIGKQTHDWTTAPCGLRSNVLPYRNDAGDELPAK